MMMATLLATASCIDVRVDGGEADIRIVPMQQVVTKGSSQGPISGTMFPDDRFLLISAYYTDPRGTYSQDFMTDAVFSKYGSPAVYQGGTSSSPSPRYWPFEGTLDFIAITKENSVSGSSLAGTVSHTGTNVAASVTYAMPDNSTIQDDVMFAYAGSRDCSTHEAVPLVFRHSQTQVAVTMASDVNSGNYGITVKRVTLRKARYSGTVTATVSGTSSCTFSWSGVASGTQANVVLGSSSQRLTTSQASYGKSLLLPPQSPSGTATGIDIYVEYTMHNGKKADGTTADDVDLTYNYTVPAVSWQAGMRYVYAFTFSLNEITCSMSVSDWDDGGTINLPTVDLSYQTYDGNAGVMRNTANSYIVKKAGTYEIPLVYGNGIKDGAVNSAAYTRQGSTYTADFVNHLGNTLTSPYIEVNAGCTAATTELLWQTHAGMVSSVTIVDDDPCRKIQFRVADIPETNGLAVVVVKDAGGNIMWSWMLWMTEDVLSPEVTVNHDGTTFYLMPENLGAIWNDSSRDLAAGAHYVTPYYQWGRKDPMCPPAAYNSNTDMGLYDIMGGTYTGFGGYGIGDDADVGGTVRSVANSIRMPEKFFAEYDDVSYNWNNLTWFSNFWNAAETASGSNFDDQASVVKTIYDPCPPGWVMPAPRAWTGFTTTGSNTTDSSQWNIIGSFTNGYFFKRNSSDAIGGWYPASGYRYRTSGILSAVGNYGYCWSAAPYSQAYAHYIAFNSSSIYTQSSSIRANGCSVRPTREM